MNNQYTYRPMSWRQFTFMRSVQSGKMTLDEALECYQHTVISCEQRKYLTIDWDHEKITLSNLGTLEMEAFHASIQSLHVKNNPESRQQRFRDNMARAYKPPKAKKRAA